MKWLFMLVRYCMVFNCLIDKRKILYYINFIKWVNDDLYKKKFSNLILKYLYYKGIFFEIKDYMGMYNYVGKCIIL